VSLEFSEYRFKNERIGKISNGPLFGKMSGEIVKSKKKSDFLRAGMCSMRIPDKD